MARRGTVNGQSCLKVHSSLETSSTDRWTGKSMGDGGAEYRFGEIGEIGSIGDHEHLVPVRYSFFSCTERERRNLSRRTEWLLDIWELMDRVYRVEVCLGGMETLSGLAESWAITPQSMIDMKMIWYGNVVGGGEESRAIHCYITFE